MIVTPSDEALMRLALAEAHKATTYDEIPVGSVVLDASGTVIGRGHNSCTVTGDPTAHAEILAMRDAAASLGSPRLDGCTLVTTLEPCPMCAGAAMMSRVARIVLGSWNPDYGAAGSVWDIPRDRRLPHRAEVVGGVLADESASLVRAFFEGRREAAGEAL